MSLFAETTGNNPTCYKISCSTGWQESQDREGKEQGIRNELCVRIADEEWTIEWLFIAFNALCDSWINGKCLLFAFFQPGENSSLAAGKSSAPSQPAKPKTDVVNKKIYTHSNKIQIFVLFKRLICYMGPDSQNIRLFLR